ncbi:MAG TPA: hypothetical protein VLI90_06260, partial [Tepidisphaeraceae bacterium]|nr:hypothetical protein [Tepidisphaeraceae bacterium]
EGVPAPVADLFALHAEHGPFDGFWQDVQIYRAYLCEPELLYALGQLASREGHPMAGLAAQAAGLAAGGVSPARHTQVGGFLTTQGWSAAAERELSAAIWLSGGEEINAYFQLARLAAERGDELAVAQRLEEALNGINRRGGGTVMSRTTRFGDVLPWTAEDAWAEVHWHYLRAAQAANDLPGVQKHLAELTKLDRLGQIVHKDPGLASDIVPALQETGQSADAQKCFDAAYTDLHQAMVEDPTNAEAKNNLAWLCARCGQRLDEAVRLADEAVAAAPNNSAYLDTAAEAHFRNGDTKGAVGLESRAIELRPGDAFMKGQLERFEHGGAGGASR